MSDKGGWRGESYGMPEDPRAKSPIPELRILQWVVPVAKSQQRGDIEVTILSIEAYDDGFVLNVRTEYVRPPTFGTPELALTIADDRGAVYRARPPGGFGGGSLARLQWRGAYFFAPALDEHAGQLRIEAPEFQWLGHDEAARQMVVAETHPGPWVFPVDLSTLPRAPARA
ncbi:MAG: hypothetical protein ACR2IK_14905 [Chloroflexota bacterium]